MSNSLQTAASAISAGRDNSLAQGLESFRRQEWGSAFSHLSAADDQLPLEADDLIQLAQAALLIGREAEGIELLARAHQAFLKLGDMQSAARYAFWLGFTLLLTGELAKASGWLARAGRLLDDQPDCVEKGYLLLPTAFRAFQAGDSVLAHTVFVQATEIGERFSDKDLVTLGLQGQGRALMRQGEINAGLTLLDEAMVAVTAGEITPLNAGGVYCSVLEACGEVFDLQRAQEWTTALEKWCESQPDLVPYRGHCLIRRAELLQLRGAWVAALEWAERASELLSHSSPNPARGEALYQVGEVQRLRGNFVEAEQAFLQADQSYRHTGPGLAQLRLAQGQVDAATNAIKRLLEEVHEPGPRARILDAGIEVMLAANDVTAARLAVSELAEISALGDIVFLQALSCRASGAVLLSEGNAQAAFAQLKQSWILWSQLEAPYDAARVRVLMALAYRCLKDEDSAIHELTAARQTFEALGAAYDLSRVDVLLDKQEDKECAPLTDRELQVLKLVASGMSNRNLASKLNISEKTVARHLSNIFTKLDLPSRTAATAYAYDHGLV